MKASKQSDKWWNALPLGEEPDGVIALKYQVTETAVAHARRRRKIPAFITPRRADPIWKKVDWGQSNEKIAAQIGYSESLVRKNRTKVNKVLKEARKLDAIAEARAKAVGRLQEIMELEVNDEFIVKGPQRRVLFTVLRDLQDDQS